MFTQIATFLVDTVVAFFVVLLLARFHFQWLRVGFRNPVGSFVVATTSWLVLPVRRVIPGLAGLDLATLFVAWSLQAVGLWAIVAVAGGEPNVGGILAVAAVDLLRYSLYILVFAVLMQVLFSWVNPHAPLAPFFDAVTRPFLGPIQRIVPLVGGVDLSPAVLLIIVQIALMLVWPLRAAVASL
ncbi:MAG TPA: YggT family protein [Burkholderiales bacterium]